MTFPSIFDGPAADGAFSFVAPARPSVQAPSEPSRAFPVDGSGQRIGAMINDLWYKNAVVYCLSVATYMDSNGDGVGDFSGLMRRLDYIHGLGVTAIWLMPFQPSPGKD